MISECKLNSIKNQRCKMVYMSWDEGPIKISFHKKDHYRKSFFHIKLTFLGSLRSLALSPEQCTSSLSPGTPKSHKIAQCWDAEELLTSLPPLWTSASQLWTVFVPWENGERQFVFKHKRIIQEILSFFNRIYIIWCGFRSKALPELPAVHV